MSSRRTRSHAIPMVVVLTTAISLALAGPGEPVPLDPLPLPATETVELTPYRGYRVVGDLVIRPDNPDVMYWAHWGFGVLKSEDGGQTWREVNNGLPAMSARRLAMDPTDYDHLLVGFGGQAQGTAPYRTVNGGERWEPTIVCDREDGMEHVRQQSSTDVLAFDPHEAGRFYYMVESQTLRGTDPVGGGVINACVAVLDSHRDLCGGFYRSCDEGASYDQNPDCAVIARPACTEGTPAPISKPPGNDATILMFDPFGQAMYVGDGLHAEGGTYALMTSNDAGASFKWEDVVDTHAPFIDPSLQGVFSLFPFAAAISPTEGPAIFASVRGYRCNDGKAYPMVPSPTPTNPADPRRCPTTATIYPPMIVRWSGGYGGIGNTIDCNGTNDCDGDANPDRVWKPIFQHFPDQANWYAPAEALLVDPNSPSRIFIAGRQFEQLNGLVMLTQSGPAKAWAATQMYTFDESGDPRLIQDPTNTNRFYLVSTGRIRRFSTTDGWQTWTREDLADLSSSARVFDLASIHPTEGQRIVTATETGMEFANELGVYPYNSADRVGAEAHIPFLATDPSDPYRIFIKLDHSVNLSTDGLKHSVAIDESRRRRDVMCTNMFNDLVVDPGTPSTIYAATGAGLWRNTIAHEPNCPPSGNCEDRDCIGEAWEPFARIAQGLNDEFTWTVAFDPADSSHSTLLTGTRGGRVYESTDAGNSWTEGVIDWPDIFADLRDVRSFQFLGEQTFAAISGGVLVRPSPSEPWTASYMGDRVSKLKPGVTGQRRLYAAGEHGLYRTTDQGRSWEQLDTGVAPPHSALLETMSRDGRHHLFLAESLRTMKRLGTTMTAHVGDSKTQMRLEWSEPAGSPYVRYLLFYGTDPDLLDGADAAEGHSPLILDPGAMTATLSDLDFRSQQWYAVLQGVDALGQVGPKGLPLALLFNYDFSPQITATGQTSCPPHVLLQWPAIPDASEYKVYRAGVDNNEAAFTLIATLGAGDLPLFDGGLMCEQPASFGSIAQVTYTDFNPLGANYYKVTTVFKSTETVETTGGNVAMVYGGCDQ